VSDHRWIVSTAWAAIAAVLLACLQFLRGTSVVFVIFRAIDIVAVACMIAFALAYAIWQPLASARAKRRERRFPAAETWQPIPSSLFSGSFSGLSDLYGRISAEAPYFSVVGDPEIQVVISVPCTPLPWLVPANSTITASFLKMLLDPTMRDVIADFAAVETTPWTPLRSRRRFSQRAILQNDAASGAPVALALLELPDARHLDRSMKETQASLHLRLKVSGGPDVRPAAATILQWQQRFERILRMTDIFTRFLGRDMQLRPLTDADTGVRRSPQIAVFGSASHVLTELFDLSGLQLEGRSTHRQFSTYAIADPRGEPPRSIALAWIIQICEEYLEASGYESVLLDIPRPARFKSPIPHVTRRALLVQIGAGAVSLTAVSFLADELLGSGHIIKKYVYPAPSPKPSPSSTGRPKHLKGR